MAITTPELEQTSDTSATAPFPSADTYIIDYDSNSAETEQITAFTYNKDGTLDGDVSSDCEEIVYSQLDVNGI